MPQLQQKQKYLRQHIEMDQYEDFAEFFQNQAGQIDINQLSFDYIKQIVNEFKISIAKQQQQQQHQRSFANYQTADMQQAYSIITAVQNSQHQQYKNREDYEKNKNSEQEKNKNQKSATDLLDSVFEQSQINNNSSMSNLNYNSKSPPNNNSPINNNNLSPNNINEKNYKSNTNISFFQHNIWSTTSNINQQRKSTEFDNFWQFPASNSSSQQFKTQNPYQNNNNNFQYKYKQKQKMPSFQQLTKNLNMQKKTNPYLVDNQIPSNIKRQQTNIKKQINSLQSNNNNNKIQINSSNDQNNTNKNNQSTTNSHQIKLISTKPLKQKPPGSIASTYKMNKIPYQGPVIHKSAFNDSIKCYQAMPRPQLNDKNLSVIIQKHQIVQRNFFVSDYVMYYLTIKPIGIVCKRNYQDFTKLRSSLQKVYPGIQLPYLQKNSWFETNLQNIKKQKAMLQFFLHDLIQNPQIRNSRIFEDFLTLKQHKAIKRKFEQYGKMDQFKSIEQLCVLNGKVDIVINQNQRIYHQQLSKFIDSIQELLNKKNKLIDTLGQQFTAVNNTLSSLSKLSQSMSEQVKKFNQRVNEDQIPILQNTFNIVSKTFQQWASRINFESKVVTKRLAPFYKYQKDNITTIRQILNHQNILYKSYIRRSASQNSTQIYTSDKLKGFKMGILQQSKNITILKYQLGYMSNRTCKQSVRFFELMGNSFKQKYAYMAQKYKQRFNKDMQFYSSMSSIKI